MNNKLSISRIKKIIAEEADDIINRDSVEELEPIEDAWSGGDNLAHPIDIADATGGLETVTSPEILSITDDRGVYRMSESKLRRIVRSVLRTK